jgi:hypothetical protein
MVQQWLAVLPAEDEALLADAKQLEGHRSQLIMLLAVALWNIHPDAETPCSPPQFSLDNMWITVSSDILDFACIF